MPCDVSLLRRISWFSVSKAFLRSMNTAVGGVLSLRFKARSSSSVASAIEVDLFLRNPYCLLFNRLLFSMYVYSWSWTNASRILPGIGKREIGLNSFGLSGFGTFGIGMTVAIFQSSGKELWCTDMLYKWVNSLCRCVMASFSILELMVFMPDDLCVFIFCMCFSTWFVVKGLR